MVYLFPHNKMDQDITTSQVMKNAIDQYAMEKSREALGCFWSQKFPDAEMPSEQMIAAVEAVFNKCTCDHSKDDACSNCPSLTYD